VEYLDHAERLARPNRCSNDGKKVEMLRRDSRERRCGSENDGDSAIQVYIYIYIDHIMIIICKTAINNI